MAELEHALGLAAAGGGPAAAIGGPQWNNELGSWVRFVVNGNALSGRYHSAVGLNGGPIESNDLSGYVNGDLVAWLVRWPDAAITAWVGRYDASNGAESLETLWQMTIINEGPSGAYWDSILAGSDTFTR